MTTGSSSPSTLIKERTRPVGNWEEMLTVETDEKGMVNIDLKYFERESGETGTDAPGEMIARTWASLPVPVAKEIANALAHLEPAGSGSLGG